MHATFWTQHKCVKFRTSDGRTGSEPIHLHEDSYDATVAFLEGLLGSRSSERLVTDIEEEGGS